MGNSQDINNLENVDYHNVICSIQYCVIDFSTNVTLERNGSMPNLNATGNRLQVDKITKLRFAYDKYLSSLEAKYVFQKIEQNISLNINEQKKVFRDEFDILKNQLVTLSNELEMINGLKIEKKLIDQKVEGLEMLSKQLLICIFLNNVLLTYVNLFLF